ELQGGDPLILTLARGHYCPKEHQQHLELATHYPKIAVSYTQVATIATDEHHTLQEFRASVGAQWPFLSDPGRIVQKDLDIAEYTDAEHDPMIPHTLVLRPGLIVHNIYNGYWFWGRPSIDDLTRHFRADDELQLEKALASMPLRVWRTDEVTPLQPHPNDPPSSRTDPNPAAAEFLTTFHLAVPEGIPAATVDDTKAREKARSRELGT